MQLRLNRIGKSLTKSIKLPSRSRSLKSTQVCSYLFLSLPEMRTQQRLVRYLVAEELVQEEAAIAALQAVDRANYVDRSLPREYIYVDHPLPLGRTGETISAPHMHAKALQILSSHALPGARVLDVGSGSGYLSACFGEMVKPNGWVLGIEKHESLVRISKENIAKGNKDLLDNNIVDIIHGNVWTDVLKDIEAFDAIHVGAAAETMPQILIDKLKPEGLMVIPMGPRFGGQYLDVVRKGKEGNIEVMPVAHVRYVPLTKPERKEIIC